ncbi:DgyrCDS12511 [Dimorphilus gyrociliatus]|uniref:DgyrCDS12511 n=1 Tax=Dimorphilus gyrociliatus TaxID=2664684 RepID=A0A7I8W6N6_9ANNE|nr:DgyrCDS12511 [Dimorphilus gyrociliatus]
MTTQTNEIQEQNDVTIFHKYDGLSRKDKKLKKLQEELGIRSPDYKPRQLPTLTRRTFKNKGNSGIDNTIDDGKTSGYSIQHSKIDKMTDIDHLKKTNNCSELKNHCEEKMLPISPVENDLIKEECQPKYEKTDVQVNNPLLLEDNILKSYHETNSKPYSQFTKKRRTLDFDRSNQKHIPNFRIIKNTIEDRLKSKRISDFRGPSTFSDYNRFPTEESLLIDNYAKKYAVTNLSRDNFNISNTKKKNHQFNSKEHLEYLTYSENRPTYKNLNRPDVTPISLITNQLKGLLSSSDSLQNLLNDTPISKSCLYQKFDKFRPSMSRFSLNRKSNSISNEHLMSHGRKHELNDKSQNRLINKINEIDEGKFLDKKIGDFPLNKDPFSFEADNHKNFQMNNFLGKEIYLSETGESLLDESLNRIISDDKSREGNEHLSKMNNCKDNEDTIKLKSIISQPTVENLHEKRSNFIWKLIRQTDWYNKSSIGSFNTRKQYSEIPIPKILSKDEAVMKRLVSAYEKCNDNYKIDHIDSILKEFRFLDNEDLILVDDEEKGVRVISKGQKSIYVASYLKNYLCKVPNDREIRTNKIIHLNFSNERGEAAVVLKLFRKDDKDNSLIGLVILSLNPFYYEIGIVSHLIGDPLNFEVISLDRIILLDYEKRSKKSNDNLTDQQWIEILITLAEIFKNLHNSYTIINKIELKNIVLRPIDQYSSSWTIPKLTCFQHATIHSKVQEFTGINTLFDDNMEEFFRVDVQLLCNIIEQINFTLNLGLDNLGGRQLSSSEIHQYLFNHLNTKNHYFNGRLLKNVEDYQSTRNIIDSQDDKCRKSTNEELDKEEIKQDLKNKKRVSLDINLLREEKNDEIRGKSSLFSNTGKMKTNKHSHLNGKVEKIGEKNSSDDDNDDDDDDHLSDRPKETIVRIRKRDGNHHLWLAKLIKSLKSYCSIQIKNPRMKTINKFVKNQPKRIIKKSKENNRSSRCSSVNMDLTDGGDNSNINVKLMDSIKTI